MQFARFRFFKKYLNDVESITGHFCHQWFVLLWPQLHSPNVLRAANDNDIRVMMIATSRVTLIVPACQPGWEKMQNLRGNLRKFEEIWEDIIQDEISLGGIPTINVTLVTSMMTLMT